MPNELTRLAPTAIGPAQGYVNITPSDVDDLAAPIRLLMVGTGGNLRFNGQTGDVINRVVQDGQELQGWIVKIHATGTSATGLVGLL